MSDSVVAEKVGERLKNFQSAADRWKGEADKHKDTIVGLENTVAEKDKTIQQHTVFSKSATVFDVVLAEVDRKLDDKAKAYIRRSQKNFESTAENEDALKTDVGTFIDKATKDYQEVAKDVFGITVGDAGGAGDKGTNIPAEFTVGGQNQNAGTPQGNPFGAPPPNTDINERMSSEMNPATNPLIPGGKAAADALKT